MRGAEAEAYPIDERHLERQVPALSGTPDHASFYRKYGLDQSLDPTPYFLTEWYSWQNPDWREHFASPYQHYLSAGQREGRDPSPFVDMTRFHEATLGAVPRETAYFAILSGLRGAALGIYESENDLTAARERFLGSLSPCIHRMVPPCRRRQALVVCQAGPSDCIDRWAVADDRDWDLMLNYYDASGHRHGLGEYVLFQKGTKFTAMKRLLDDFGDLLMTYDHVLFLDDDIETTAGDLNSLFAVCRAEELDLAQMSLTPDSACNWTHLYARPGGGRPRAVSAVEIMMPVFSRRALAWIAPTLGQSVSGFGLDLVWGQLLAQRGGRIAVLDDIAATHARPVDQAEGGYYRYLRQNGINAKAELWTLLRRYGASRDVLSA